MLNITTFLDANAMRLDKPIFHCPERELEYNSKEVLSIISEIGRKLKKEGIKKGDRIIIYLENSPEYLFSLFAAWRIGAIAVTSNKSYTISEIEYIIKDSGAKLIITDLEGRKQTKDLDIRVRTLRNINQYSNAPILDVEYTLESDICQLQYTSGTTGSPKGAMLTYGNWLAAIQNECDVLTLKQNDIFLGIYPMGHVGVSWGIAAMRSGALYIMMEKYNIQQFMDICEKKQVTVLSGMPPVIYTLTQLPPETQYKFDTVREIISGGGPLHSALWKKFYTRYHIPIINAYGLSETLVIGTGTVIRPEDYTTADKFQSVGHPVCFTEVKIVDESDPSKKLNNTEVGEIALRGPAIAKGYWNMPDKTEESFLKDGWFLTGDLGYLDEDNRLCITDRKKDMIIMSGWKIYPTEVEEVMCEHPAVAEAAIFGIPDEKRGELPLAEVVWKEKYKNNPPVDELLEYTRERLVRYKVPRKIYSAEELPKVNNWKILRRALREKYE